MEKYITSAEVCQILNVSRSEMWNFAGKELTPPVLITPRKAAWLRAEVIAFKPKLEARRQLFAAA